MNKNKVIFILCLAVLLGSTWGAVLNRQNIDLGRQLKDARQELEECAGKGGTQKAEQDAVSTRQASLAECQAELSALVKEKKTLAEQLMAEQAPAPAEERKALSETDPDLATLQYRLEECEAQTLGLEKILEEKNDSLQAGRKDRERQQVNTDVLLAKISEQQSQLQILEEAHRELLKQLAAEKNSFITPSTESPKRSP